MADLPPTWKKGSGAASSHGIRRPGINPRFQRDHRRGAQGADNRRSAGADRQSAGEVEIAISAVTVAELVHGVYRANTQERQQRRRMFIDDLKRHVPVHPLTDETGEIIGGIRGQQAAKGDRKSTRLNSSHLGISYAVFCLKKKVLL